MSCWLKLQTLGIIKMSGYLSRGGIRLACEGAGANILRCWNIPQLYLSGGYVYSDNTYIKSVNFMLSLDGKQKFIKTIIRQLKNK